MPNLKELLDLDVMGDDLPESNPLVLGEDGRYVVVVGGRERRRCVQDSNQDVEVGPDLLSRGQLPPLVADVQVEGGALHNHRSNLEEGQVGSD